MTPKPADDRAQEIAEGVWDALDAQHDKALHIHAAECCWSFGGAIDAIAAALSDNRARVTADLLAEHEPALGLFAGRAGIVGCSCLSARDYRAAGHQAGQKGWRNHVAAALSDTAAPDHDPTTAPEESA